VKLNENRRPINQSARLRGPETLDERDLLKYWLGSFLFGPTHRKVSRLLNETTQPKILRDLSRVRFTADLIARAALALREGIEQRTAFRTRIGRHLRVSQDGARKPIK
jgi:hypothetical protein